MPRVQPFHGVRYDPQHFQAGQVLAPPYDIVSPAQRVQLGRVGNNVVHLELPQDEAGEGSRYGVAARRLGSWMERGVLRRDKTPAFYPYRQSFRFQERDWQRTAVFGVVELAPPGKAARIHPHETTLRGPREDRYRLLEATGANLSPIFLLYSDPSGRIAGALQEAMQSPSIAEARTPWDISERLWSLEGEQAGLITEILGQTDLVFADGHHRYESALRYHESRGDSRPGSGSEFVLAAFVERDDPGLLVLPTHRILRQTERIRLDSLREAIDEFFETTPIRGSGLPELASMSDVWLQESKESQAVSLVAWLHGDPGPVGLRLRPQLSEKLYVSAGGVEESLASLEVVVLQGLLQTGLGIGAREIGDKDALHYTHSSLEAWQAVHEGEPAAFLVPATPVKEVIDLAAAGHRLPQKTTYFYPKVTSGWLFHVHERSGEEWRTEQGGQTTASKP